MEEQELKVIPEAVLQQLTDLATEDEDRCSLLQPALPRLFGPWGLGFGCTSAFIGMGAARASSRLQ